MTTAQAQLVYVSFSNECELIISVRRSEAKDYWMSKRKYKRKEFVEFVVPDFSALEANYKSKISVVESVKFVNPRSYTAWS